MYPNPSVHGKQIMSLRVLRAYTGVHIDMTDKDDVSMPTRDEISALRQRFDNALPIVAPQQHEIFSETIIMLRRIADARDGRVKDAERYRWLAEHENGDLYMENPGKELLDRAIDHAMLAAANKERGNG